MPWKEHLDSFEFANINEISGNFRTLSMKNDRIHMSNGSFKGTSMTFWMTFWGLFHHCMSRDLLLYHFRY